MQNKPAHKSKVMWFSLALVIFGALSDNISQLQNLIDPKFYSITVIVIGVICAVLRFQTKGPIE
jgi:lipoprotein signal peptidase